MTKRYFIEGVQASDNDWVKDVMGLPLERIRTIRTEKVGIDFGKPFFDADDSCESILGGINYTTINKLYFNITMTDGDGLSPLGMLNDGVSKIDCSITIEDSNGDTITTLNDSFRIVIRSASGAVYDQFPITFVDGVASFSYTTTSSPDICTLSEEDLITLPIDSVDYAFGIKGDTTFKIYRSL